MKKQLSIVIQLNEGIVDVDIVKKKVIDTVKAICPSSLINVFYKEFKLQRMEQDGYCQHTKSEVVIK